MCCRCVGMADDAKHIKRRPVARYPGYQRLLPGSPRGAGAEGKKKGRLPDGSGPQQFEPRGGSGLLLRVSPRGSRALWSNKGRQPYADGPGHDGSPFVWLPHKPNHRGPSPGNDGRECRCRSGVKEKPGQSCLVAGHPDKKRHPTTFYSGDLYVVLDFL